MISANPPDSFTHPDGTVGGSSLVCSAVRVSPAWVPRYCRAVHRNYLGIS
jgi:hypothetical protein